MPRISSFTLNRAIIRARYLPRLLINKSRDNKTWEIGIRYPQSFNSWPFIKSHHLRIMAEFPRVNKIQSRRNRNRNNTFRKERKVDYCAFQCAHVSYHSDGGLLSKQVFQNCVGVGVAPISFLSRSFTSHDKPSKVNISHPPPHLSKNFARDGSLFPLLR